MRYCFSFSGPHWGKYGVDGPAFTRVQVSCFQTDEHCFSTAEGRNLIPVLQDTEKFMQVIERESKQSINLTYIVYT